MYLQFIFLLSSYTSSADSLLVRDSTTYLYGNVRFNHKDLKITSKRGILTNEKIVVRDSVVILKEELEILTDFGEYFWNKEIKLYNGFVARKKNEVLSGKTGKYFEDKLWATEDVKYLNEEENLLVYGNEGFYDFDTHYGIMTKSPKFEFPEDSIEIFGDTIEIFGDTLTKVISNTIIKLKATQCFAESLVYLPKSNYALLYGNPYIISETDSIGGEQIKVALYEKKIKSILVKGEVWGKKWKF